MKDYSYKFSRLKLYKKQKSISRFNTLKRDTLKSLKTGIELFSNQLRVAKKNRKSQDLLLSRKYRYISIQLEKDIRQLKYYYKRFKDIAI